MRGISTMSRPAQSRIHGTASRAGKDRARTNVIAIKRVGRCRQRHLPIIARLIAVIMLPLNCLDARGADIQNIAPAADSTPATNRASDTQPTSEPSADYRLAATQSAQTAGAGSITNDSLKIPNQRSAEVVQPTLPTPVPAIEKTAAAEWVVAPIPGYNPSQGWTGALVGQYIFHPDAADHDSPPSTIGMGGFYSQQDSFGFAGGYAGYLAHDRVRLLVGGGGGRINYDFFGVGNDAAKLDHSITVHQTFAGGVLQVLPRIAPHIYLGPRYEMASLDAQVEMDQSLHLPSVQTSALDAALGLKFQWDTRDNTFAPGHGRLVELGGDFFNEAFGGDFNYQTYDVAWNEYLHVHEKGVLALRAYGRFVFENAPFFALSQFGEHNDLRGYVTGKYRDRMQLDAQGEYRLQLAKRFGVVAFAGLGEVAPNVGSFNTHDLLWSAGAGLRFKIAKDNPVNFRFDWAIGVDGSAFYLGVGEAF